jgi:hypothetical protein
METMKMKFFLLIGLTLTIAPSVFASPFVSYINCAGPTLVYTSEAMGGGPVPPTEMIVGHWLVFHNATEIDSGNFYAGQNPSTSCRINFDGSSKKLLMSEPTQNPNETYELYSISMTAACANRPSNDNLFVETVYCSHILPNSVP